jgi:hypothetical protein
MFFEIAILLYNILFIFVIYVIIIKNIIENINKNIIENINNNNIKRIILLINANSRIKYLDFSMI